MEVGPVAAFYFENYATMWHQVHEMLHIEKGGEAQIADELAAYNPLIPKGRELIATVMFEVDDEVRRRNFLGRLGGIEETAFLRFGGEKLSGVSEADLDRTTADGKASAVQFIHFPFSDAQVEAFRTAGAEVIIGFDHPNYSHMAVMPEAVRAALAEDFD
jgi:class 3 adenylate cyclase